MVKLNNSFFNIFNAVIVITLASSTCASYGEGVVCYKGIFESYGGDCNKYLRCVRGKYMVRSCPSEYHWNNVEKACDFPDRAKCVELDEKEFNWQRIDECVKIGGATCSGVALQVEKESILINNPKICNSGEELNENRQCTSVW